MTKLRKPSTSTTKKRVGIPIPRKDVREAPHTQSPTAVAAEAMMTGVVPISAGPRRPVEFPGEDDIVRAGQPDERAEDAAFVGDATPAGDMPTPDQSQVDPYGRAMGVAEEDSGALRTSSELLDKRDRHRSFQEVPEDHSKD